MIYYIKYIIYSIAVIIISLISRVETQNQIHQIFLSEINVQYDTINKKITINEIIDLNNSYIEIPKGYSLHIKDGKIFNGIIKGDNTSLRCDLKGALGITMTGSWSITNIEDSFFDSETLTDKQILDNINTLQSDLINQTITLSKKEYCAHINSPNDCLLKLSSNTDITLNTSIKLKPNNFQSYNIIEVRNKNNISIRGGHIWGDIATHKYVGSSTHEWGMGIFIYSSSNIRIENTIISNCTGDGIYVGGGDEHSIMDNLFASKNIYLSSVTCDSNRRQGLSIIHVDGMSVNKCHFVNTGTIKSTPPSAGLDIEPNLTSQRNNSVRNVKIQECVFLNNSGRSFEADLGVIDGVNMNIDNIILEKCSFDNSIRIGAPNLTFKECNLQDIQIRPYESFIDCEFIGCMINNGVFLLTKHKHSPLYQPTEEERPIRSMIFKNCIICQNDQTGVAINVECNPEDVKNIHLYDCVLNIENDKSLITSCCENIIQKHSI